MKTYFTSDPHFGHARIIELCDRPFASVDAMNMQIIENYNRIAAGQRLVILGDICMGKLDETLPLLDLIEVAELILVPGNHDRWSLGYARNEDKREASRLRYEAAGDRIKALPDRGSKGWRYEDFGDTENSPLNEAHFSHYPYEGDSGFVDRYANLRVPQNGPWPIIHGHVHESWKTNGRQFNVGVDVNGFAPVSEDEIAEWMGTL